MAMPKHQLAVALSKKSFSIEEKIKLLDAKKKTRRSCRQLADQLWIGRP